MTTIVTKSNSKAYAIYLDSRKIVECHEPETTYNELVKNIGISTDTVQVVEMTSFPDILPQLAGSIVQNIAQEVMNEVRSESHDIEDVINAVNSQMTKPNKNPRVRAVEPTSTAPSFDDEILQNPNEPVGNVAVPKLGNLIYVDGIDGMLRKVTGGIGTVHLVYNEATKEEMSADINEDDEDLPNILVELEEVPGVYFSWTELKDNQEELKQKYGYKPVCAVR